VGTNIHYCEDDIGLVAYRRESNGRDHDDHEIEGLAAMSVHDLVSTTDMTPTQFAEVDKAFAGARIRKGTISAGYSHVMPSQPTAKKVLKMKRKSAATIPGPLPPRLSYCSISKRHSR